MTRVLKTRNRIREVRESVGISQTELGRRVNLSEPAINRYERGGRKPTREKFHEIAEALGVPLRDLFVTITVIDEGSLEGAGNGKLRQ